MLKLKLNLKKLILVKNKYINFDYFISTELNGIKKKVNNSIISNIDLNKAVKDLNNQGFYLVEKVFDENLINQFEKEFDYVIEKYNSTFDETSISNSSQVRIFNQKNMIKDKLYACSALFGNLEIKNIIKSHFKKKFIFNSDIFFQRSGPTKKPLASEYHFDILNSIKVWLYVDDCYEDNGPLEVVKESFKQNKEIREVSYKNLNKISNVSNIQEHQNTLKLTAPKGSIIIFNTDLLHRATEIKSNFIRKVIRGHSFSEKALEYNYELQRNYTSH